MTLAVDPIVDAPPLALGRLVVLVRDYDEALAFYRAAFGATVIFDAPIASGGRYLHLGFGGTPGVGVWLMRASDGDAGRVGKQTGGEPMAVFYTTDVRAALGRAEAAGAAVVRPLQAADGAHFTHVADLYGNVFLLVELAPDAP